MKTKRETRFETISRFRSQIFGPGTSRSDSLADWKTVKHLICLSKKQKKQFRSESLFYNVVDITDLHLPAG